MTLTEFVGVCARLEAFCIYARRRAPYGEPELLEKAAALERDLLPEYNAAGENLAFECARLAGNPAQARLVEKCRESFAVAGHIQALSGDLASGATPCPENLRGRLILALNGLYSLVSALSRACAQELNNFEPQGAQKGKTAPEWIESSPRARSLAGELQKAGYLAEGYQRAENYRGYMVRLALIGQRLAVLCNCSQSVFEEFWGLKLGRISKDANAAGACEDVREILKRY